MDKMNDYLRTAQNLLEAAEVGTASALVSLQAVLNNADEEQMKALIELFENAAANGIRIAYKYLTLIYSDGLGGVPVDHKKALQYLHSFLYFKDKR